MDRGFGFRSQDILSPLGSRVTSKRLSRRGKCIYGRLWPNGEFTVGVANEQVEECENTFIDLARLNNTDHQRAVLEQMRLEGVLGLSSLPNSHILKNRPDTYGRRGITAYGRRCVRSAAYLLEKSVPRGTISFLTLTLPPMSLASQKVVARNWGSIINRLVQWLSRRLKRAGIADRIVAVTELQSRRFSSDPLGALHVHLVFQGRRDRHSSWCISCRDVRLWWLNKLSLVTGEFIESNACENLEVVRKSAQRYISKYLTKGAQGAERIGEEFGWEYVPRQWWNWNAPMRDAVRSGTYAGSRVGEVLESTVNAWLDDPSGYRWAWMTPVVLTCGDITFVAGWAGRLSSTVAGSLRRVITST